MKHILVAALVLVLGLTVSPAHALPWRDQCRFQHLDRHRWTTREVKATIRCAVNRWPVSGGLAKADYIAYRESRYHWHDTNQSSGACGIYQNIPRYWPGRQNKYDRRPWPIGESCYNARSNVMVAIRMVHAGGWGPWGG